MFKFIIKYFTIIIHSIHCMYIEHVIGLLMILSVIFIVWHIGLSFK